MFPNPDMTCDFSFHNLLIYDCVSVSYLLTDTMTEKVSLTERNHDDKRKSRFYAEANYLLSCPMCIRFN